MRYHCRGLLVGFLLLVGIAGLSVVATGSVAAQQVDVAASDLNGSGTQEDPYVITNASELQAMNDEVDAHYELGNDIDASNTTQWNSGNGFDPIGGSKFNFQDPDPFTGSLDGNGYTITNLTVNRSTEEGVGLIGQTGSGAAVSDITLRNNTVNGSDLTGGLIARNDGGSVWNVTVTGNVTGSNRVGGLVGDNDGSPATILNVTVTGTVTGSDKVGGLVGQSAGINMLIKDVRMTGTVNGDDQTGGLVGENNNPIQNATVTGDVAGRDLVGGLVGKSGTLTGSNYAEIVNATATGNVTASGSFPTAGGLVGENYGPIRTAKATGNVIGGDDVGGLIGINDNDAEVQNAMATGNVSGGSELGGLIGDNAFGGSIRDTTATGTVTGVSEVGGLVGVNSELIQNATATGAVDGSNREAGGLVGTNYGPIQNVTATGNVTGSADRAGGLVGSNFDADGEIRNATATGSVNGSDYIGGLVGSNSDDASIRRTKATGSVTGSNNVSALAGANLDDASIKDSFAVGPVSVTGGSNIGGLVAVQPSQGSIQDSYWDEQTTGQATSAGTNATGLSTAEMTGQAAETNMSGLDFDAVWQDPPDDYPVLRSQTSEEDDDGSGGNDDGSDVSLAGDGTESDPYVITNASELQAMEDDLEAYYELGNDIDASNTSQWNNGKGFDQIGGNSVESSTPDPFNGSLDGNGYTVTKLTINRSNEDTVGLIGQSDSGAVVSNISIKNVTVSGSDDVGGLAGDNRGTIQNVRVTGSVTGLDGVGGIVGTNPFGGQIKNATAAVTITSTSGSFGSAGGLVGSNDGPIQNVRATGNVTGSVDQAGGLVGRNSGDDAEIRNATATGDVSGDNELGGLVGANINGEIQNATATGTVTGSNLVGGLVGENDEASIRNATAAGDVSGSDYVGGLAGANIDDSSIRNTKATGSVTGSNNVSGLVGVNGLARLNLDTSSIEDSFAVGSVSITGGSNVGGLVAVQPSSVASIDDAYWDKQTTGQATSEGGVLVVDLSTAEMTGQAAEANMSGLDFDSVWQTQPDGYPVLRLQSSNIDNDSGDGITAKFTFTPSDPLTNEEVTFNAGPSTASAGIDSYQWDFDGDGTVDATGRVVNHSYINNATYNVVLNVTDTNGNSSTATSNVSVTEESCFIATAAYGTPYAEEIDILRDYRDGVLREHTAGDVLVETYYTLSPPVADTIRGTSEGRMVVREFFVDPLVQTVSLGYSADGWVLLAGLVGAVSIGVVARNRGEPISKLPKPLLAKLTSAGVIGVTIAIVTQGTAVFVGVTYSTVGGVALTWAAVILGLAGCAVIAIGVTSYPLIRISSGFRFKG